MGKVLRGRALSAAFGERAGIRVELRAWRFVFSITGAQS
jgi:hypothetical protein